MIGDVVIGAESSIWLNAVVRGDVNYIRIGRQSNLQDGVIVHVNHEPSYPTVVGDQRDGRARRHPARVRRSRTGA